MWARGMQGGGGGGGGLAREIHQRNRQERIARDGPLSDRREVLIEDGQEIARHLAEGLPEATRARFEAPADPNQTDREFVEGRCDALLEGNQDALGARGDSRGSSGQAFLQTCRRIPADAFRCMDRGEEGRRDPDCRPHLAQIDGEVRRLRGQARQVAHPEQRIDSLVDDPWEREREPVAPESLAPPPAQ